MPGTGTGASDVISLCHLQGVFPGRGTTKVEDEHTTVYELLNITKLGSVLSPAQWTGEKVSKGEINPKWDNRRDFLCGGKRCHYWVMDGGVLCDTQRQETRWTVPRSHCLPLIDHNRSW